MGFLLHSLTRLKTPATVFALLLLNGLYSTSHGDDTDIYSRVATNPASAPVVMLVLDYRPNLGNSLCQAGSDCENLLGTEINNHITKTSGTVTTFDAMRAVFATLINQIEGVRLGAMISHDDNCKKKSGPSASGCSNGAYILQGAKPMLANDGNGAKQALLEKLAAIPVPQGNLAHSYQGKEVYFELFRYLSGQGIYNGHLGYQDYGNSSTSGNLNDDFPSAAWDSSIENGGDYLSPITEGQSCTSLYAVNLLFQVSNHEDDSDDAIKANTSQGGMGLSGNNITFPDVISWTANNDIETDIAGEQTLKSYFFSTHVNTKTNGYASAGGTGSAISWTDDAQGMQQLLFDLRELFRNIISESTTLVAASVPVNVFNRAEINANLYTATFRVDPLGKPNWPGNLKKLEIDTVPFVDGSGEETIIKDALNNRAIAADGRIRYDALTFWTDSAKLPPPPSPPETPEDEFIQSGKDGRAVKRGGAGQNIEGFRTVGGDNGSIADTNSGGRTIYLEPSSGSILENLNADQQTATTLQQELGAESTDEALSILHWARGNDPDTGAARDWILADPLHSRPTPINYGARTGYSQTNPDIRILMGSNEGLIHLFQNTLSDGSESGKENWAFMPRAMLSLQKQLKDESSSRHPYGVDGEPEIVTIDLNQDGTLDHSAGDKVYAFFGMRRGGSNIYALDISNPDSPSFLWSITGGTGDFTELALSFSKPRAINIAYGENTEKVALIFGGGYHGGYDSDGNRIGKDIGSAADTPNKGNAIFIVEASTGQLIWKAVHGDAISKTSQLFSHPQLIDSIPSMVEVLDSNGDGYTDRAYVGDSGGTLWRIDFASSTSTDTRANQWQLIPLAKLDDVNASGDRRFFHRPDIVQTQYGNTAFDAILIGSGNRADPLEVVTDNWFYLVKDYNILSVPSPENWTTVGLQSIPDITSDCLSGPCTSDIQHGWRLQMQADGEKVLAPSVTIHGEVFFTSYLPEDNNANASCEANPGSGRLYTVSLFDGSPTRNRNTYDDNGNLLPSTNQDRYSDLTSRSIPTQVVPLSPSKILLPDLTVEERGNNIWKANWINLNRNGL